MQVIFAFMTIFVAAQGLAITGSAYLAYRCLRLEGTPFKVGVTAVSYALWSGATLLGYALLGGSFSMMDGGAMMAFLCATALWSAGVWVIAWLLAPRIWTRING